MKNCSDERIGEVVALAEQHIPVDKIATGPGTEMGLGPGYEHHGCLDFVLQELGRFPAYGAKLVEAGLKSSVIRNRNGALRVLSEWGKEQWPQEIEAALQQALSDEPDDDVRGRIQNVIDGKPLD